MNRLVKIIASCDLQDTTSLRTLYQNNEGNRYFYEGIEIVCEETHKTTPESVRFTLEFPLSLLGLSFLDLSQENLAAADFCLREFGRRLNEVNLERTHQTGKEQFTGKFTLHTPIPKMIARNSSYIQDNKLCISLKVRFPVHMMAKRNVVQGRKSVKMIRKELGRVVREFVSNFDLVKCKEFVSTAAKQAIIREFLRENNLVCFIANGSILPRAKGTELPLQSAVPFKSPFEDEVVIEFPDGTRLIGMGIKEGVTVITGGGYSGKSTLMDAMYAGIYNHIPGDGREYCITQKDSVKICAEDGRPVTALNIKPFIRNVPSVNTESFTSSHASGSTSQAANIIEAITFGAEVLLIDEDKTATNFMIRDARMKTIIQNDPIIPFTDRVRQLYRETEVSTVLIIGGSSEYIDIADNIYIMNEFVIENYKSRAEQQRQYPYEFYEVKEDTAPVWKNGREIVASSLSSYKSQAEANRIKERVDHEGSKTVFVGDESVDIGAIESIVSIEQARAIAFIIRAMAVKNTAQSFDLMSYTDQMYDLIEEGGLDSIYSSIFKVDRDLELPKKRDVLRVISRMRYVQYR